MYECGSTDSAPVDLPYPPIYTAQAGSIMLVFSVTSSVLMSRLWVIILIPG